MHSKSDTKRRAVQLQRRQDDASADDGSIDWLQPTQLTWRMCETVPLAWTGGQAPYKLAATHINAGSPNLPLVVWDMIDTLDEHNANGTTWTAEVPGPAYVNLTLSYDTEAGVYAAAPMQLTILDTYALGLTSCSISNDFLQAQAMAYSGDSDLTISGHSASSSSSTTSSASSRSTNASDSHHDSGPPKAAIKGLASMVALLGFAILVLGFFYYRLHRRMKRLQKGQSTVGKWMNHQQPHPNHGDGEKGDLSGSSNRKRRDTSSSHASSSSVDTNSSNPLSTLSTRMNATLPSKPDDRSRDRTWSRFSIASTAEDPFAGSEVLQSARSRHSQASTVASEAPTITSNATATTGRLSTNAPSTVGGYSFVSDEHYTRQKASTISPNGTHISPNGKSAETRDFLRP